MVRLRKPGLDMAVGENMLTSRYLEQNFIVFHIVSYGTAEDDLQLGFGYLQILLLQHTGHWETLVKSVSALSFSASSC